MPRMNSKAKKTIAIVLCMLLAVVFVVGCAAAPASQVAASEGAQITSQSAQAPMPDPTPAPTPVPTPTPTPLVVTSDYVIEKPERARDVSMGPQDTWTVFIYMCGTDLESRKQAATKNLDELFQVEFSANVNVIIQTGGTEKWHTEGIDPTKLQRFLVKDGGLVLLDEQELANMGSASTLYGFLSWGVENYPADKMGLIFWNHGGGSMVGTQYDQLYGRDPLSLPEMDEALASVFPEMADKFEFVGFDACLMATIETAGILAPYARYLVASEEVEPAGGWNYTGWAQYLSDTPRATGADVGRVICDNYLSKSRNGNEDDLVTLSVVDLTKLDNVLYAFNNMARELTGGAGDPAFFADVSRGTRRTETYGGGSSSEGYTNLIDMGDMAANIEDMVPESASVLLQAIDEAVLYTVHGPNREFATGLSVFYPLVINPEDTPVYAQIAPTPAYYDYVSGIIKAAMQESGQSLVEIAVEPYVSVDGYYEMQIAPQSMPYVQGVYFDMFYIPDGENLLYYIGSDSDLSVDWQTGVVRDNFHGKWAMLGGQPVSLLIMEENESYNLYTVPVKLNGEQTNLRVIWNWTGGGQGYFTILGAWDGIDPATGMAAREIRELKEGDVIVPLYHVIDTIAEAEVGMAEGGEIAVSADFHMEFGALPAGRYLYGFAIQNVYGDYAETQAIGFTIDNAGGISIDS